MRITTYKHRSMFLIKNELCVFLPIKSHFNRIFWLRFNFWVAINVVSPEIEPDFTFFISTSISLLFNVKLFLKCTQKIKK